MRFILFSCFAILFFAACSNFETVEKKDESGKVVERYTVNKKTKKKEGEYLAFFPSGVKMEESQYIGDSLNGERKLFHENGQVDQIFHHANGMFEGIYQKFNEQGKLTNEGQYVNNVASGIWKRWYDSGQLMEEVTIADNKENGPFKEYYENGKMKAEGSYIDGENENGELKMFDENGELEKRMYCEYGVCFNAWTKEKGDNVIDTVKMRELVDLKKQHPEVQ